VPAPPRCDCAVNRSSGAAGRRARLAPPRRRRRAMLWAALLRSAPRHDAAEGRRAKEGEGPQVRETGTGKGRPLAPSACVRMDTARVRCAALLCPWRSPGALRACRRRGETQRLATYGMHARAARQRMQLRRRRRHPDDSVGRRKSTSKTRLSASRTKTRAKKCRFTDYYYNHHHHQCYYYPTGSLAPRSLRLVTWTYRMCYLLLNV